METLKSLLTVFSFIALLSLNQGCLPDSFKKFKQGTPKSSDGAGVEDPEPTTTDDFNPDELNFPTKLAYAPASPTDSSAHTFKLVRGEEVNIDSDTTLLAFVDGDLSVLSDPDTLENGEDVDEVTEDFGLDQSGGGFSLTTSPQPFDSSSGHNCPGPASQYESSLPKGLEVDKETGVIFGTPSEITADGNGAPLTYCLKLAHIDENENFSFKEVRVEIAVYQQLPEGNSKAVYENGDRLILEVGNLNTDINAFDPDSGSGVITTNVADGNLAGLNADVTFIDENNGKLFLDRGATANGSELFFGTGTVVDNSTTYQAQEGNVEDVTNVFQVSTTPQQISLLPRYEKFICVDEKSNTTQYTTPEECLEKAGSCSDSSYSTRTDCFNAGETWSGGTHNDPSAPTTPTASDGVRPNDIYDAYTVPGYLLEKNAVKFFVDHELPPSLPFNQETGELGCRGGASSCTSGGYLSAPLSSTTFNVRVISPFHPDYETASEYGDIDTNAGNVFEMSFKLAVVQPPQDISLSNTQLLEVSNNDKFQVGDVVSNPKDTENQSIGTVLHVLSNSEHILVRIKDGRHFETDDPIDNRYPYSSAKAFVFNADPADVKLTLSTAAGFNEGERITSDQGGGVGVIQKIDGNDVYIKLSSTSLSEDFAEGDDVDNTVPFASSLATVNSVSSYSLKIASTNTPANREGAPILNGPAGSGGASGEIHEVDGSTNFVTVVKPGFQSGQDIDYNNPYETDNLGSISDISTHPGFYYYQEDYMELQLDIDMGEEAVFKFDPGLPPGLSFDPETQKISGTPTERLDKTTYKVTASNSVNTTEFQFDLQIYDFFELVLDPSEEEEYVSYVLHKEGRNNKIESCRITRNQINSGNIDVKNLTCFLEAGEAELASTGVDLKLKMPKGVCQQIGQRPYYFYQHIPRETPNGLQSYDGSFGAGNERVYKHSGADECDVPSYSSAHTEHDLTVAKSNELKDDGMEDQVLCLYENGGGDYSNLDNLIPSLQERDAPNCDEGEYDIQEVDWRVQEFVCLDPATFESTSATNAQSCFREVGTCTADVCGDGGTDPCENYKDCTDAGETWQARGIHNEGAASTSTIASSETYDSSGNLVQSPGAPADLYDVSAIPNVYVDVGVCDSTEGVVNRHKCGGDKANCTNGPGSEILTSDLLENQGILFDSITNTQKEFDIERYAAPDGDYGYDTNVFISNYHSDNSCVSGDMNGNDYTYHSNKDGSGGNNHLVDYSFNGPSLGDPDETLLSDGSPTYEFRCADGSGVTKAKITLMIRDWNNSFSTRHNIDEALPNDADDDIEPNFGSSIDYDMDQNGLDEFGDSMNQSGDLTDFQTSGDMCTNKDIQFNFGNTIHTFDNIGGETQDDFPGDAL